MENPDAPEIYRPLAGSQTRLIYIQPGQPDELIRCEFKHVSLGQNVEYCALSYVWGDPNHTKNIELDGKLVSVHSNGGVFMEGEFGRNETTRKTR